MLRAFDRVREGSVELFVIAGPPGAGKTRVVQEVYATLAAQQTQQERYWPPTLLEGASDEALERRKHVYPADVKPDSGARLPYFWWGIRCQAGSDGTPKQALADDETQLKAHCGSLLEASLAKGRAKRELVQMLRTSAGAAVPILGWIDAAAGVTTSVRNLVKEARLAKTSSPTEAVAASDNLRADLVDELVDLVETLARPDLPFVVVLDDAHYADPSAVKFVRRLMLELGVSGRGRRKDRGRPAVLLISTTWTDELEDQSSRRSGFGGLVHDLSANPDTATRCTNRTLGALDISAAAELVKERGPATSTERIGALIERSGGNPLVLENLLDSSLLRRDAADKAIDLSPAEIQDLPGSVQGVYQDVWRRRLPVEVRLALTVSSLQGIDFLRELTELAAKETGLTLEPASVAQAVHPHGWAHELEGALRFSQREFYSVAREGDQPLSKAEQVDLHRKWLDWILEARAHEDWGDKPTAYRVAACTVGLSLSLSLAYEGVAPIDRHRVERAIDLSQELFDLQHQRGLHLAALDALDDGLNLRRRRFGDDDSSTLSAMVHAGWLCRQLGDYERGVRHFTRVLDLSREGDQRSAGLGLSCLYCDQGDWHKALAMSEMLAEQAKLAGDEDPIWELNCAIYLRCLGHGDPERTREAYDRMNRLAMAQQARGGLDTEFQLELQLTEAELQHGLSSSTTLSAMLALADHYLLHAQSLAQADYHYKCAQQLLRESDEPTRAHVLVPLRLAQLEYERARGYPAKVHFEDARIAIEAFPTGAPEDLRRTLQDVGQELGLL